ncbi:MAG: glycosyltransferase family 4 protein [Smithella sp.]
MPGPHTERSIRLRAGLLISGTLDKLTGGNLYDRMLVEHLRATGHYMRVFSLPGQTYPSRLLGNFAFSMIERIKEESLDILLQDELEHAALFQLNQRLKKQIDCPVVSIVHHLRSAELRPSWQNSLYRMVERRYLQSVDGFVFNGENTKASVHRLCGRQLPMVVAHPGGNRLGADTTEAEIIDRARQPGAIRVLFVGNVIRRKGLHVLVEAMKQLPVGACTLTIIGSLSLDKRYVREIIQQIDQNGMGNRVAILGALSDRELSGQLKSAHVLAVPSSYEGFGIVYLESRGFGLPAIGSAAGGAGEIITHEHDGFLLPVDDVHSLARYLNRLHQDRNLLTAMSLNAFQRFQNHPTWQQTCRKITAFMESMTTRNGNGSY